MLFYIESSVLAKYHVVVTTYDTVKSEYASYSPPAKDESRKVKSKAKVAGSDSESESLEKTRKSKAKAGAKRCALFAHKWWRIVLGALFKKKLTKVSLSIRI